MMSPKTIAEHIRALAWKEKRYDRARGAVEMALDEDLSPHDRARNVLRRCYLDPTHPEWAPLMREIAKEICAAQNTTLKNWVAFSDAGKPSP